jgi:Na+/proline symporter
MIRIDLKMVVFGFLTWFIPFGLAYLFYTPEGELAIDIFLFKTIMMLVGAVTGATLLALYFKRLERNYLYEGVKVGLVWFALNIHPGSRGISAHVRHVDWIVFRRNRIEISHIAHDEHRDRICS